MSPKKRQRSRRKGADAEPKRSTSDAGRGVRIVLWALVWLPPLVFSRRVEESFRLPKLLLSEVLAVLSILLLVERLRRVERAELRAWLRRPVVLAVAPILLVATLGLATSDHQAAVRSALVSLWVAGAALVAWASGLDRSELRRLVYGLVGPATLLSLLVVYQFHVHNPFEFDTDVQQRIGLTSLAGGAFDLAAYLVFPLLVAQAGLARAAGRRRWLWAAALAVLAYALAVSQTLTAIGACLVGTGVFWLVRGERRRTLVVATVLALAATLLVVAIEPLQGRVREKMQTIERGRLNDLLSGRLDGWRGALWMVEEHPVFGVGHGAYRAEYGLARLALVEDGHHFTRQLRHAYFVNAHHDVLEAVAEWGLLGLLALVWAAVVLVRAWRGRAPPDEGGPGDVDRALVLAGLVALAVQVSTNFPLRLAVVAYPQLFLLAWIFRSARRPPEDEAAPEGAPPVGVRGPRLAWVLLPLVALALVGVGRHGLHLYRGQALSTAVEARTVALARSGRLPPAVAAENLRVLDDAARMSPAEVRIPVAQAAQYLLTDRPDAALRAYGRALELEPRAEIYVNYARAAEAADELEVAIEAYRKAARLDLRRLDEVAAKIREHRAELASRAREAAREAVRLEREERRREAAEERRRNAAAEAEDGT